MAHIKIKEMLKNYPIGRGKFTALKGIDLEFKKGEFTGIVGPSGSGKTTLLNIIGSLDVQTEGLLVKTIGLYWKLCFDNCCYLFSLVCDKEVM